jgi:uncharacterized protein (DUF58 family)
VTPVAPSSPSGVKRVFRIATLFVPSALAWYVAFSAAHPGELTRAVKFALGPLWVLLAAALVLRTIGALHGRRPRSEGEDRATVLAQLDVLTSSGSALAWLSAFSIMGAVWLGWASLATVGLLGTGLFHVVVLLTFACVRGSDPMRSTSLSRRFLPEVVTEGDSVIEELRFAGARIPIGFRLFATGRIGPRWALSRHVLEGAEACGEVVLQSEVGPAVRGEHDVELLELWLQDTFGLCRSVRVMTGAGRLTVLPRLRTAEKTAPLMDRGDGPRAPRPASRLPTEGSFHLREYQQGDDVRRIHWVRSLAARELIVRLPDEVPPDQPHVRLVLDTFFPEASELTCNAASELLDSIVSVWLAVGQSLLESGARVTLVAAIPRGDELEKTRHELSRRTTEPARRLGAQVSWQDRMKVEQLLTDEATYVVSRAVLALPSAHPKARWIVVLPTAVTPAAGWPFGSGARLQYPMGSSENRWARRRREGDRIALARRDHSWLMVTRADIAQPPVGSFFAAPEHDGPIQLRAIR